MLRAGMALTQISQALVWLGSQYLFSQLQLLPVAFSVFSVHLWRKSVSDFFALSQEVPVDRDKFFPKLSLLWDKQTQLLLSFYTTCSHPWPSCGPPMVVTPVHPGVSYMGSPKLDTTLQMLCHKSQTEERSTSLVLLASLLLLQPRMWLTFFTADSRAACCPEGPISSAEVLSGSVPTLCCCKALFHPRCRTAFSLVEFHTVFASSMLRCQYNDCFPQWDIICELVTLLHCQSH